MTKVAKRRKVSVKRQMEMDVESLTAMLRVEKYKSADWEVRFRAAEARISVMNLETAQAHKRQMAQIIGVSDE